MYLDHFGLRRKPFSLAFEPTCYYPAAHQEATNDLCYSIEERQGLATLVGEPGTGKTTLLNNLLKTFDSNMKGVLVSDASLGTGSLLKQLTAELGLPVSDPHMVPVVLRGYLQNWVLLGKSLVLLVDEAQALADGQLEELRHLTNLEVQGRKLIEIVLAGQPPLEARLAAPEFEALRQRIAVRSYLKPLSLEHTAAYIHWRLEAAGSGDSRFFGLGAIQAVHRRSCGVPRLINLICDRALLTGYADDARSIEATAVELAANELGINEGSSVSSNVPGRPSYVEPEKGASHGASGDLEARLTGIERKLDTLVEMLMRAGLESSVRPEKENEETPSRSSAAESESGEDRLADFPRLRRGS
ncbi:MAG: ExeA family protein [Vicinamibacteria bacterium]